MEAGRDADVAEAEAAIARFGGADDRRPFSCARHRLLDYKALLRAHGDTAAYAHFRDPLPGNGRSLEFGREQRWQKRCHDRDLVTSGRATAERGRPVGGGCQPVIIDITIA